MDKEIKAKWLEALRSGKFSQTHGCLNRLEAVKEAGSRVTPVGFCCLGVLACVMNAEWAPSPYDDTTMGLETDHHEDDASDPGINVGDLPVEFLEDAGLDRKLANELMSKNDGAWDYNNQEWGCDPWTFAELADYIEEHA